MVPCPKAEGLFFFSRGSKLFIIKEHSNTTGHLPGGAVFIKGSQA